ncbi:MAG: anti-sigma factor family protein [Burkholderiales bacterium]
MLSCKDVSHLVARSADRKLSLTERVGLRFHLWICDQCRRFEHNMALIGKAFKQLGAEPESLCPPHIGLSPEAEERLRQKLKHHCHSHP